MTMTREELQRKIADIEKVYEKRYYSAMQDWYAYKQRCADKGKVVVKPEPTMSEFKRLALLAVDKARKEYLMESFPVRIGDMVEVSQRRKSQYTGKFYTWVQYLRVEKISVSGVEHPTLKFGGKWFKHDGKPFTKQPEWKLASQNDIFRYGPNIKQLKPISNEEAKD